MCQKKKDILNIYVKSQIINIFFENLVANSQLYLWPYVKISSLYLKCLLNNNSVNFAKKFGCEHAYIQRFSRAYLIASKNEKGNDFQINQITQNIHKNMLLLQKTGFLLDITDWIRVLNQRI